MHEKNDTLWLEPVRLTAEDGRLGHQRGRYAAGASLLRVAATRQVHRYSVVPFAHMLPFTTFLPFLTHQIYLITLLTAVCMKNEGS